MPFIITKHYGLKIKCWKQLYTFNRSRMSTSFSLAELLVDLYNGKISIEEDGKEERDLLCISVLINFLQLAINKQDISFCLLNKWILQSNYHTNLIKKIISISGKNIKIEYDISKSTISNRIALKCQKEKKFSGGNQRQPWKMEFVKPWIGINPISLFPK